MAAKAQGTQRIAPKICEQFNCHSPVVALCSASIHLTMRILRRAYCQEPEIESDRKKIEAGAAEKGPATAARKE